MFRHLQLCRVCRDDGAPSTLLRVRPTNSISADAFTLPFVYVSNADRVIFLETLQAEGTLFAEVQTSSGVTGFVQAKYLTDAEVDRDANPVGGQDVSIEMTPFQNPQTLENCIQLQIMQLQLQLQMNPAVVSSPEATNIVPIGNLPFHSNLSALQLPPAQLRSPSASSPESDTAMQYLQNLFQMQEVALRIEETGNMNQTPSQQQPQPLQHKKKTTGATPGNLSNDPSQLYPPHLPATAVQLPPPNNTSNHFMLWPDGKVRNQFLIFFSVYVIWAALDIAFDVLFAVESSRLLLLDLPDSLPLRHFFPATVACLGASMLLTMYANIPVLRRAVLVSRAQHDEESQGSSQLVWQEFVPAVVAVFYTLLVDPVAGAGSNFHKLELKRRLLLCRDFFVESFVWLANAVILLCRNVVSLFTLSMSGRWKFFDHLDSETFFPPCFTQFNTHIVDSFKDGVSVEFCGSTASAHDDDAYLLFLSIYIVRPIGALFNFKTQNNPNADIDISDPLNAGYFERVTTWWSNYEDWEEQPALSFFTYIPLLLLLIVLPIVQIVASLGMAVFHFISMLLKLVLLPLLSGLGFHSGPFISFCNIIKYATGAFCIFSDSTTGLPCLKIRNETCDLNRYSSDCRGISSLHALHVLSYEIKKVPSRFKVVFVVFSAVFYPLRAIMSTLASLLFCSPMICVILFTALFCVAVIMTVCLTLALCLCVVAFAVFTLMCASLFILTIALLTLWFFISIVALFGMELLCFVSAMTNPEVGLILYDDVDERRYKLGAAAGFLEDFPGFILQSYYTHLMGIRGSAGTSRAISLALSSWRMLVLTVKRFIKFRMMARDKRKSMASTSQSWEKEKDILMNSYGVATKMLIRFRSSLFPDVFSAFLRLFVFGMYAGFFGWMASQSIHTQSGFSSFLDSNFPIPNICPKQSTFATCDFSAQCQSGDCVCDAGFGGDGLTCTPIRSAIIAFTIASADRKAGKTGVPVTLSFNPGTRVPPGKTITLTYPSGFFAPSVTPTVTSGSSNVAGLTVTCSSTTATSLVITTAGAVIPPSVFVVTLAGLTMGSLTSGGDVTVQISTDLLPSAAVGSGRLVLPISNVRFAILDSDRQLRKPSVPVTLGFTPANSIPSGGTITLTYPSGFFAPSVTPRVTSGSSNVTGLTGTCSSTTATSLVITTAGAIIPPSSFVVTLTGLTMGNFTLGGDVTVRTSTDLLPSAAVHSGTLGWPLGLRVRLKGLNGNSCSSTSQCCRVEVLHEGAWGTICDDGFSDNEARVVCQGLGYFSGRTASGFGGGSGPIWLDNVQCGSSFAGFIGDCSHNGWGSHNCGHDEDVGVCCS